MSFLCVELLYTQERLNPEIAFIFGAAARYRRATVFSSHDDARPITQRCTRGRFAPPPAL